MKVPFLSFYDIYLAWRAQHSQQLTPRFDREGLWPIGDAGPSEPDGELILAYS
jgi:hypothetical protein